MGYLDEILQHLLSVLSSEVGKPVELSLGHELRVALEITETACGFA